MTGVVYLKSLLNLSVQLGRKLLLFASFDHIPYMYMSIVGLQYVLSTELYKWSQLRLQMLLIAYVPRGMNFGTTMTNLKAK